MCKQQTNFRSMTSLEAGAAVLRSWYQLGYIPTATNKPDTM